MRVDVYFGVQGLQPPSVQGRVVAVIDVLRASTVVANAARAGPRGVEICTRTCRFSPKNRPSES